MASPQTLAREHQQRQKAIATAAVLTVRSALKRSVPAAATQAAAQAVARYQVLSAATAAQTMATEAGASNLVNAAAFAGVTAAGYPVADPLTQLVQLYAASLLTGAQQLMPSRATFHIDRFVASEVQDAGRSAGQLQIYSGDARGEYVRVLQLPSCSRCVVLAGRVYADDVAFDRHPLCDCVHWPVENQHHAVAEGFVVDPTAAVKSGEVTGLSRADRDAILDGADPAQVINARRGLAAPGITAAKVEDVFGRRLKVTSEGTTARGAFRRANPDKPFRLRPEAIYQIAVDREDALRLLRVYGYLTG